MIDGWMAAMVRASWQGAIAVALVWIACKSVPRLPSNVRCWLWRLALLKTVLATLPLGSFDVPVLPHAWVERQTANTAVEASPTVQPFAVAVGNSAEQPSEAASAVAASATSPPAGQGTPIGFTVLFAAWLAVLAAFLGTIVVRVRGARRWRREWRLIKDHGILAMGERLSEKLGLFQPPVLFEADSCRSPVVFGAVRTAIVLPARLVAESTPGRLELILAHEMAHIRRYDLLGNWFSTLVSGLFFFHPLVWLAARESRLSQELACDELAVRRPDVSVVDYGRLLVDLATQRPAPAIPLVTVGVVESFQTFLKRRLSAMKSIGTRSRKVFVVSWMIAMAAVLGLLPWRLAAAPKADGKAAASTPGEQRMNVETTSGPFKIAIDRVRYLPGHMISMVPSGMPLSGGKGEQRVEEQSFEGGMGRTATATMGGGSGGAFTIPNLVLDIVVKAQKAAKKQHLLCAVEGKVRAVDDLGHDVESDGSPSWLKLQLQGVDYPQGSGRTAIHLSLPSSDPEARYLKTVEGELVVALATVNQVTFQGNDLTRKTSKRSGGFSARLDKIDDSGDGIDVTLAITEPAEKHEEINPMQNPMQNPMESMQRMMLANAPGRVNVVLVDSEGKTHTAGANPNKSAGPNGVTFFGGGGGGTGGSSGGSWGSSGPNGHRSGSFSSSKPKPNKPQDYHFDILPAGVKVKAITCTVTDITGAPKTVPFKFENVRLPESRR